MKLLTLKKNWFSVRNFTIFFFIIFLISCSMTIDSVEQPMSVKGGEILPVTLNVTIETNQEQTSKFMVAVLVPKVWNARKNTSITFTSDITSGDQRMSVIPEGTPEPKGSGMDWPTLIASKVGNGGNLINDYEWVAFSPMRPTPLAEIRPYVHRLKSGQKSAMTILPLNLVIAWQTAPMV